MAHTPGPWITNVNLRFQHDSSIGVMGSHGLYLAAALDFNRYDRDEEVKANARLIAAAPTLLESLEVMVDLFFATDSNEECAYCHGNFSGDEYLPHHENCPWLVAQNDARAIIAKAKGETT